MSVKVRLTRSGSKKHPFYRVVAINSDTRRDGRPLEFLGYYNPNTNPAEVKLDQERIEKWLPPPERKCPPRCALCTKNCLAEPRPRSWRTFPKLRPECRKKPTALPERVGLLACCS